MNADGASQFKPIEYPEDTTDYRDEDVLVRKEREREARSMGEPVSAEKTAVDPNFALQQAYQEYQYQSELEIQQYNFDVHVRSTALDAVIKANLFENFDDLLSNTQQLYVWLTNAEEAEAAGAAESAQDGGA